MKHIFCALFIVYSQFVIAQNEHVLYGERNLNSDKPAIYIDRFGNFYPNVFISDSSLRLANSSLSEWYQKNPAMFINLSRAHRCIFSEYSLKNLMQLNDSIAALFIRTLNQKKANSITFMIHGFRKAFKSYNADTDSPSDYLTLSKTFKTFYQSPTLFAEVYWDGLYGCCFSANGKKNEVLFRLFEEAQVNAEVAGNHLKKILSSLQCDTLNIITYSLGAKVGLYSLLNLDSSNNPTPSNKRINICLIAPALSSELIESNYLKRIPALAINTNDNYVLSVVFNENDFALKKKDNKLGLFGPGPYRYGNTSLGCNCGNSIQKLQDYFNTNFTHSRIRAYDLSSVGKCHLMRCYCNSDNLKTVFEELNN